MEERWFGMLGSMASGGFIVRVIEEPTTYVDTQPPESLGKTDR